MAKLPPRKSMHKRRLKDLRFAFFVYLSFALAMLPLISLLYTVVSNGIKRMDLTFFTSTMWGVMGSGGGILHALLGTLEITFIAFLISAPLGLLVAIYLVEYGRGLLAKTISLGVDVMAGIPSIVAGLFAYALFSFLLNKAGVYSGFIGALALSILMLPIVIRSGVEVLRLVPNDLREAAYALGTPKWRTILLVVLPTAFSGITTGVTLSIARIVGETAPLLLVAGYTSRLNLNPLQGRMMTLPVYIYTQYSSPGLDVDAFMDRAWSAALVLVGFVLVLYLVAWAVAKAVAPKSRRF